MTGKIVRAQGAGASDQRGATMIEVLIAVLVLAVGLLGVAALQATALRNSQSSYERSQATILAYSLLDAIRVDRANAAAYNTAGWLCDAPAGATLAEQQLADWFGSFENNLGNTPSTCVRVSNCEGATCTIELQWDDSRGIGTPLPQTLETRSWL
jgi:type IV pilus assembly protein PilV